MVNEEKVKIMNRLAMYEHGEGRKYLPVSRYYRSDYIGPVSYTHLIWFSRSTPKSPLRIGVSTWIS